MFADIGKQSGAGAYLPPRRCWFPGLERHHRAQQGRTGPAGPPPGCRPDPRSRFGSPRAPSALQLHSDPPLSRGVRRDRRLAICTYALLALRERSFRCLLFHQAGEFVQTRLLTLDTVARLEYQNRHSSILRNTDPRAARAAARHAAPRLASPKKRQLSTAGCHVSPCLLSHTCSSGVE